MIKRKSKSRRPAKKIKSAEKPSRERQTKQERLIAMLRRAEGAGIEEIAKELGWQPHTIRGVISGALKKRLGLNVTSVKMEGLRKYRLAADGGKGA